MVSVSEAELREGIGRFGLSGRPVCAHCSLRSFGHVEGGAGTLVSAFLAEGSTLLVPSFSWNFSSNPPAVGRPTRNGTDYDFPTRPPPRAPYDRGSTAVDPDMGALSAAVVLAPERERGGHPLCSFAAIGPLASDLVDSQQSDAVWAPLEALVRLEGAVVLMGVDLTRLTLTHLAEVHARRRPFVRWAHYKGVTAHPVDVGSCSNGFAKLAPLLTTLTVGRVGPSEWTALPAAETLSQMAQIMESSPEITHCGDAKCERCRDAVAGGPLL